MSCTPTLPTADEAWRDIKLAAELEGLSEEELTRKGATIYARRLLAQRDALFLLSPEPWRQFRLLDDGYFVSFVVCIPTPTFSQAVSIENEILKAKGWIGNVDACEFAEAQLCARLDELAANSGNRDIFAPSEWLKAQHTLENRLKEIEKEVEHA